MRKLKDRHFVVASGLIILLVISGLFLIWFMVRDVQGDVDDLYNQRLLEEAEIADDNIGRRLRLFSAGLNGILDSQAFADAEAAYVTYGDAEPLSAAVVGSPLMHSAYILEMRALLYDRVIYQYTAEGENSPEIKDVFKERFSLAADKEGDGYLIIGRDSQSTDITYQFIFSLVPVLSDLGEPVRSVDTGVFLYDPVTGIFVRERNGKIKTEDRFLDGDSSQVLKAVLTEEENGEAEVCRLVFQEREDEIHHLGMYMIPSRQSSNDSFAVGIIEDLTAISRTSRKNTRTALIIMTLANLGLLILFLAVQVLYTRKQKNEDQIAELGEKNRENEELLKNRQVLEQRERLQMIGVLTSSVAHEFNNLLTPIMGYSAMSLSELTDEEGELAENLSEIYTAASRAKHLISRMSAFSRKSDAASFQYLSPDAVLDDVSTMAKPAIPAFVTVIYERNCPEPCIFGDRMQLLQLFLNLELNAYQAMKDGGGTLSIRTECAEGHVTVSFRDTGKGIDSNETRRIFDPFYTTKGDAGTGLGLPIAKRIAEAHGAEIRVSSEPGKGAVFSVVFPEKRPEGQTNLNEL